MNLIPSSFQIFGQTINVIFDDKLLPEDTNGMAILSENIIRLGHIENDDLLYQTFLHEVMHFIFYFAGFEPKDEERLVDLFSHMLYQIIITMEFEDE